MPEKHLFHIAAYEPSLFDSRSRQRHHRFRRNPLRKARRTVMDMFPGAVVIGVNSRAGRPRVAHTPSGKGIPSGQLLTQLQASEHDKFAAHLYRSRRE